MQYWWQTLITLPTVLRMHYIHCFCASLSSYYSIPEVVWRRWEHEPVLFAWNSPSYTTNEHLWVSNHPAIFLCSSKVLFLPSRLVCMRSKCPNCCGMLCPVWASRGRISLTAFSTFLMSMIHKCLFTRITCSRFLVFLTLASFTLLPPPFPLLFGILAYHHTSLPNGQSTYKFKCWWRQILFPEEATHCTFCLFI